MLTRHVTLMATLNRFLQTKLKKNLNLLIFRYYHKQKNEDKLLLLKINWEREKFGNTDSKFFDLIHLNLY